MHVTVKVQISALLESIDVPVLEVNSSGELLLAVAGLLNPDNGGEYVEILFIIHSCYQLIKLPGRL
jgi:hypothetical protein